MKTLLKTIIKKVMKEVDIHYLEELHEFHNKNKN